SDWRGIRDRIAVELGLARTGVTSAETVVRRLETTPGRQSRRALELRLMRAVKRVERLRSRASSRLTSAPQPVAIPEVRRVAGVIARARTLVDPEPLRPAGVPLPQRKPLSSRGARLASVRATTDAVRSYALPERNPAAQRREDRRRIRLAVRAPDRRGVVAIPDPPTRNARRSLRMARVERRVTRRRLTNRRVTKRRLRKAQARRRSRARSYRRRRWRGRYRSRRYVVRRGDSLWAISRRFYGRGRRYRRIYVANRAILRRPSRIYPGQRLIIPAVRRR
ncbi:MAG: LysM peptidoglycan-binding domain-containing protein, partial [Pseudomonadota bacterium]